MVVAHRPRFGLLFLLFANRLEQKWVDALLGPMLGTIGARRYRVMDIPLKTAAWWVAAIPVAVSADSARIGRKRTLSFLICAKLAGYWRIEA